MTHETIERVLAQMRGQVARVVREHQEQRAAFEAEANAAEELLDLLRQRLGLAISEMPRVGPKGTPAERAARCVAQLAHQNRQGPYAMQLEALATLLKDETR